MHGAAEEVCKVTEGKTVCLLQKHCKIGLFLTKLHLIRSPVRGLEEV